MKSSSISREFILAVSRQIISEQGFDALNIRRVASACQVAIGSVYNYFPSKGDLVCAVVENVWRDIFHMSDSPQPFSSFPECVNWLFCRIKKGCEEYPEFFTLHSMSFAASEKKKGREVMNRYFGHIRQNLLDVLCHDSEVCPDVFGSTLTEQAFVEMVFSLLIGQLLQKKENCLDLLELISQCLYHRLCLRS